MHMVCVANLMITSEELFLKKLDILFRFINFIHTSHPGLVKYSHMHREELVQSSDLPLKV